MKLLRYILCLLTLCAFAACTKELAMPSEDCDVDKPSANNIIRLELVQPVDVVSAEVDTRSVGEKAPTFKFDEGDMFGIFVLPYKTTDDLTVNLNKSFQTNIPATATFRDDHWYMDMNSSDNIYNTGYRFVSAYYPYNPKLVVSYDNDQVSIPVSIPTDQTSQEVVEKACIVNMYSCQRLYLGSNKYRMEFTRSVAMLHIQVLVPEGISFNTMDVSMSTYVNGRMDMINGNIAPAGTPETVTIAQDVRYNTKAVSNGVRTYDFTCVVLPLEYAPEHPRTFMITLKTDDGEILKTWKERAFDRTEDTYTPVNYERNNIYSYTFTIVDAESTPVTYEVGTSENAPDNDTPVL